MEQRTDTGPAGIRMLFARRSDPYAGADLASARRMTGLIWILGTIVALGLLPLSPTFDGFGLLEWTAIGVMTLCALAACRWLVDPRRNMSFDLLLGLSYVSMAFLVLAQWLTGGAESPLRELYLLSLLGGVCVQPPRRAGVFLLVSAVAMCSPLFYDGWSRATAVDLAARGSLWFSLAFVAIVLMAYIRGQRVALRQQEQEAQTLARRDLLTGLPNRRAFEEAVGPGALLLIDIDRFKSINDTHGHVVGDDCLRQVAEALRGELRDSDRCFRWGGDEFIVFMPDTPLSAARTAQSRLAEAVASQCRLASGESLAVSIGVTELRDPSDLEDVITAADAELFRDKRSKAGLSDASAA
jgi:diguanylate cyclase (GGDEF)-like protein